MQQADPRIRLAALGLGAGRLHAALPAMLVVDQQVTLALVLGDGQLAACRTGATTARAEDVAGQRHVLGAARLFERRAPRR